MMSLHQERIPDTIKARIQGREGCKLKHEAQSYSRYDGVIVGTSNGS